MIVALCVDDQHGMLFNGRRQSQDKLLLARLLERARGRKLWMNAYSAKLFSQMPPNMTVREDFLQLAGSADICFVENVEVTALPEQCDQLILYHWNRRYPADVYFPEKELEKWKLVSALDFPGNSHDVITEKVYEKK